MSQANIGVPLNDALRIQRLLSPFQGASLRSDRFAVGAEQFACALLKLGHRSAWTQEGTMFQILLRKFEGFESLDSW